MGKSNLAPDSTWEIFGANKSSRKGKAAPFNPFHPLTWLLGLLGELLRALGAVGHWVTEGSVLLAGVRVLPGGVVRNLNLSGARKQQW